MSPPDLRKEWQLATEQLAKGHADLKHSGLGIGLLNFKYSEELLQAAISLQPRAMWLGFGDWQPTAGTIKEANIKLFCMVPSLEAAAEAIEAGADVIGSEAGGHGFQGSTTLFAVLPEMVDFVAQLCAEQGIRPAVPVVATGGITDGRQIAAALVMGADGVAIGTRLNCTPESTYPEHKKKALLEAGSDAAATKATVRTTLYDDIGTRGWETMDGVDGRALHNDFIDEHSASTPVPQESRQQLAEKLQKAGLDSQVVWAGSGVGMIKSLEPATQLIGRLIGEAQAVIDRAAKLAGRTMTQTES
eukprot:jgi/Astpho2/2200/Aster-x1056